MYSGSSGDAPVTRRGEETTGQSWSGHTRQIGDGGRGLCMSSMITWLVGANFTFV